MRSVQRWLEQAQIVDGPLFRKVNRFGRVEKTRFSPYSVAVIVKKRVQAHQPESGTIRRAFFAGWPRNLRRNGWRGGTSHSGPDRP